MIRAIRVIAAAFAGGNVVCAGLLGQRGWMVFDMLCIGVLATTALLLDEPKR